jgi:hypothetical protein
MKKFLIITTINPPTKAITEFAKLSDWKVVVIGDKKTPTNWYLDNVKYLSDQGQLNFKFKLPWNNYVRKMIGYLYAIQNGADVIAETDDDNIPYEDWCFPEEAEECLVGKGFENIYKHFSNLFIWPRGFPLQFTRKYNPIKTTIKNLPVGIWQGLADQDPDVDAIYRLVGNGACMFRKRKPFALSKGLVSPFNSQNTLFKKEMFPLLYLPVTVNQRFADILRSYIAQPIMWVAGYHLGITQATVYQERNEHDLMKDFVDELPCYLHSERAYEIALKTVSKKNSIHGNLMNIYCELLNEKIVKEEEINYLCDWLDNIGE